MPATRPSTQIQRQAQSTVPRRQSSGRRTTSAATAQRQATSVGSSTTAAPHLATESPEGAATFSTSLNDATFEHIVSAVSQAFLSSVNINGLLHPQPPSLAAAASPATTDLVEMPVIESGSALSHPATASTPVATLLKIVVLNNSSTCVILRDLCAAVTHLACRARVKLIFNTASCAFKPN